MAHLGNRFPFEERDQLDQAEAYFNNPLRIKNKAMEDEIMALKKLLRENGISWSPALTFDSENTMPGTGNWSSTSYNKARKTRSSGSPRSSIAHTRIPTLPVEIQLHILEYAMTSKHPIIDPLAKVNWENMTAAEKKRDNQIAIGFLATCKAYLHEGTRFLWSNNTFVFTSPHVLRDFCNLDFEMRKNVKQINLRIIAKYYDEVKRNHTVPHYPSANGGRHGMKLRVTLRPKPQNLSRKGFRSYTWSQTSDFLDALRPPFDPDHNKKQPRPALLPGLESMRIDFINFPFNFLSFPDMELHRLAVHDLGCTLNELMVTGLPTCEVGLKALADLSGMVRDDGLLVKCNDAFVVSSSQLRPIPDGPVSPKAIRAWKTLAYEHAASDSSTSSSNFPPGYLDHHRDIDDLPEMPAAPEEEGHPESIWKRRQTIWKRVPLTRDSEEREWVEFDRTLGEPMSHWQYSDEYDVHDVDGLVCDRCGEIHDPMAGMANGH